MSASDLVSDLRAAATDRTPSGRQGLWLTFLSAYGLEAVLGARFGVATGRSTNGATGGGAGGGAAAIEWLGVDLQHGDLDLDDVIPLLRVAERLDLPVFPRMASHAGEAIGKVLDAGVHGVIVPGVDSADEAAALVRAFRLPPRGARSSGSGRTSLGVTSVGEPLLLPMVETSAGLEAATDIVAVDGVDGVFVGPYDLSISLGCRPGEPEVMGAIERVVEIARSAGKIVGMFAGRPDLLDVAAKFDLVAVDTDAAAVRRGIDALFA